MAAPLANIGLNPFLTGPLWFSLRVSQTREQLLQQLSKYMNLSPATIKRATTTLQWAFIIGLARWANRRLSDLAQNNFRSSSEAHRYDWPHEIAVVTGGTGGFGRLMCKSLAASGLTVICVDIQDELPEHMKGNSSIRYYQCDITDPSAVQQLAKDIRQAHGDPKILINNAGVAFDNHILSATPDSLRRIFDVNIISHYHLLQAFMPAMIADKKGHIVSIASMASFISTAGLAPYGGTKAAVLALHEGLRQECRVIHNAPEIKFTIVHPTYAQTPLIAQFQDQLKQAGAHILRPEVVSDAVVKQIMSCRGKQIILAGNMGWISCLRAFPQWLQHGIIRLTDSGMKRAWAKKTAPGKQQQVGSG